MSSNHNTLSNRKLLILGAGGHGRVVKETAAVTGYFETIDFLDDNPTSSAVGLCEEYKLFIDEYMYAFPAFGNNQIRMEWLNKLKDAGFKLPVVVHSTAYISPSSTIEEGSIIEAKAVVNTNAVVGKGCIVGIGALIDHDSHVGEGCHIDVGAIVKSLSIVESMRKIEAGVVYAGSGEPQKNCCTPSYSYEVGV